MFANCGHSGATQPPSRSSLFELKSVVLTSCHHETNFVVCQQYLNIADFTFFRLFLPKSVISDQYLSLLAGLRFSSCFRLLGPVVAASEFNPQPPLCLLPLWPDSLLSASASQPYTTQSNRHQRKPHAETGMKRCEETWKFKRSHGVAWRTMNSHEETWREVKRNKESWTNEKLCEDTWSIMKSQKETWRVVKRCKQTWTVMEGEEIRSAMKTDEVSWMPCSHCIQIQCFPKKK